MRQCKESQLLVGDDAVALYRTIDCPYKPMLWLEVHQLFRPPDIVATNAEGVAHDSRRVLLNQFELAIGKNGRIPTAQRVSTDPAHFALPALSRIPHDTPALKAAAWMRIVCLHVMAKVVRKDIRRQVPWRRAF